MKKIIVLSILFIMGIINITFAKFPKKEFKQRIATRSEIATKSDIKKKFPIGDFPKKEDKPKNINGFEYSNILLG